MNDFIYRPVNPRLTYESSARYVNFESSVSDGKVVLTPSEPVKPSLASEFSVALNVLNGRQSPSSRRLNVDAVDVAESIQSLI